MEAETKYLFQGHILLLLAEDLPHDFRRLLELSVIFLLLLDVVVAFDIVKCNWDAHEGQKVHPGETPSFACCKKDNESCTVEGRCWCPKELMMEHGP